MPLSSRASALPKPKVFSSNENRTLVLLGTGKYYRTGTAAVQNWTAFQTGISLRTIRCSGAHCRSTWNDAGRCRRTLLKHRQRRGRRADASRLRFIEIDVVCVEYLPRGELEIHTRTRIVAKGRYLRPFCGSQIALDLNYVVDRRSA